MRSVPPREHRLSLRSDAAVARSHRRIGTLVLVGWLLGTAALVVLVSAGSSGTTIVYAALGGASIGLWPRAHAVRFRRRGRGVDQPSAASRPASGPTAIPPRSAMPSSA